MSFAAVLALVLIATTSGCFWRKEKKQAAPNAFTIKPTTSTNLVIRPATSAMGLVKSVVSSGKFVIVSFPVGQVPTNDARFAVFHAGVKVGEIKITPPAGDNMTAADIIAGNAEENDEVRSE